MWALRPCVTLRRTSHYSSFEKEGPSDERIVSPAECQTQRLTSLPGRTLLGNVKMDADGRGAGPASIMTEQLQELILLFASQGTGNLPQVHLDASARVGGGAAAVEEARRTGF